MDNGYKVFRVDYNVIISTLCQTQFASPSTAQFGQSQFVGPQNFGGGGAQFGGQQGGGGGGGLGDLASSLLSALGRRKKRETTMHGQAIR